MGEQVWLHGAVRRSATSYPRCDSSECLLCQSAAHEMCRENEPLQHLGAQRCLSSSLCTTEAGTAQPAMAASWRGQWASTPRHWGGCCGWHFDSALDTQRTDPAPAQLVQVAELVLGPAQFVNALEFSQDGWLLATGSCMRKEVRLYNVHSVLQASLQPPAGYSRLLPSGAQQHGCLGTNSDASDDTTGPSATGTDTWTGQGTTSSTDSWWDSNTQASCTSTSQNTSQGGSPTPLFSHRLPGKVSCVTWSPALPGVLCVGDYDGVITQLHVATGHQLRDIDGHGGKRIWGLSHTHPQHVPLLCASASDDGTARIWGGAGMDTCVAVLRPGGTQSTAGCSGSSSSSSSHGLLRQRSLSGGSCSSVCGVDFSHHATQPHLLALACADHTAYVYDIRCTEQPLHVLSHHTRPVSYAKFFGPGQLVTASTDGSLAIWDLSAAVSSKCSPIQHMDAQIISSQPDLSSHVARAAGPCNMHALYQTSCKEEQSGGEEDSMLVDDEDDDVDVDLTRAELSQCTNCSSIGACAAHQHSLERLAQSSCRQSSQQQHSRQSQGGAATQVFLQPWKVLQGHKNERNFVGLAVRPEDGLMACGSETSQVYTYHRAWTSPLAISDLLPAGPAVSGSQAGVAAWQLPGSIRGNAVATWKQQSLQPWARVSTEGAPVSATCRQAARLGPEQFHRFATTSLDRTPCFHSSLCSSPHVSTSAGCSTGPRSTHAFVSSVAWQPAAVGMAAGLPPLLAAGTSAGTVKLLALERPRA